MQGAIADSHWRRPPVVVERVRIPWVTEGLESVWRLGIAEMVGHGDQMAVQGRLKEAVLARLRPPQRLCTATWLGLLLLVLVL